MIVLPIDTVEPYQDISIALDGTTRDVRVRYSNRERRYYVHIYDTEGNAVAIGVKVLVGKALLKPYQRLTLPGQLFALSNTVDVSPPVLGELGSLAANVRVNLYYISQAEGLAL